MHTATLFALSSSTPAGGLKTNLLGGFASIRISAMTNPSLIKEHKGTTRPYYTLGVAEKSTAPTPSSFVGVKKV